LFEQVAASVIMSLTPENVRYLRNWQVSIMCFPRDPDLELVWCLRLISNRIIPQLAPPINVEEHPKQTKFSAIDEFMSKMWAGYLKGIIRRNDRELAAYFKNASEEVMADQGFPNSLKLGFS
jgi:hypothetical protein